VSGDDDFVTLDDMEPAFICACRRDRMERALMSISEEEREEMKREAGFIEIKCSFCKRAERW